MGRNSFWFDLTILVQTVWVLTPMGKIWPVKELEAVGQLRKGLRYEKNNFYTWPSFDKEIISAVREVLISGKVSQWTGHEVYAFEEEYARYLGVGHAIAMAIDYGCGAESAWGGCGG